MTFVWTCLLLLLIDALSIAIAFACIRIENLYHKPTYREDSLLNTLTIIPCGENVRLHLFEDGTAMFEITIHHSTHCVPVSAPQIETFSYQLANRLGDTR